MTRSKRTALAVLAVVIVTTLMLLAAAGPAAWDWWVTEYREDTYCLGPPSMSGNHLRGIGPPPPDNLLVRRKAGYHRYTHKKHGPFFEWYGTGQMKIEGKYRHGELQGQVRQWDPSGRIEGIHSSTQGVKVTWLGRKENDSAWKQQTLIANNTVVEVRVESTNVNGYELTGLPYKTGWFTEQEIRDAAEKR